MGKVCNVGGGSVLGPSDGGGAVVAGVEGGARERGEGVYGARSGTEGDVCDAKDRGNGGEAENAKAMTCHIK